MSKLGAGFIARTIDIPLKSEYNYKLSTEEPNFYPEIYMDIEKAREKRRKEALGLRDTSLFIKEQNKIKEINARIKERSPLINKSKNMRDTSLQIHANDQSIQVTPHLAGQMKLKGAATQFTDKKNAVDEKENNIKKNNAPSTYYIVNPAQIQKENDDMISTCRHADSKYIITENKEVNPQKRTITNLDESEIKYKDSDSKIDNTEHKSKISESKYMQTESQHKQNDELTKSRSHTKNEESRLIQLKQMAAEKNESIELLRKALQKAVKIVKKQHVELKKYNKSGKIQQEAANFLAEDDCANSFSSEEVTEFLEVVNRRKLLETNYPLQIKDKPPQENIKNGMLVTFKNASKMKEDNSLGNILTMADDSQSIIDSLSKQLCELNDENENSKEA